jgi:hypothetical protein
MTWSAVALPAVNVVPHDGQHAPLATACATSLSLVRLYSDPYAFRCCSVFGAQRDTDLRSRGATAC